MTKLRSARCSLCPCVIEPIPYVRRLMRETGVATVRELHFCHGCGAVVCKRGHPVNAENTRFRANGLVARCRICELLRWRELHGQGRWRKELVS